MRNIKTRTSHRNCADIKEKWVWMSLKDEQYKLSNIISNDIEVYGQHYKITYFKQCSTGKIVYKYALRTARLLTVLGGGGLHTGGSTQPRGSAYGAVCPTLGVCIQVGICIRGGSVQPGGSASREVGQTPLPHEQNDTQV